MINWLFFTPYVVELFLPMALVERARAHLVGGT